jgi:tetratricopeptide (TPR) repeat protein
LENFKNYINTGETNFLDKALFASVKIALELKLFEEALELLQKLEKVPNIDRSELFFLFGKTYFSKQLFFYANDAFEKAIKRGKKDFETFYLLGRTNLNIGEYDNAILAFENALNLVKENAELLALIGFAYIGKGEIETAQKYLTKAMEDNPFDKNVIALKNKLLNLFEVQNRED